MTEEDAIRLLEELKEEAKGDPEAAHSGADNVLCELLIELGYKAVVEAWRAIPKWYA